MESDRISIASSIVKSTAIEIHYNVECLLQMNKIIASNETCNQHCCAGHVLSVLILLARGPGRRVASSTNSSFIRSRERENFPLACALPRHTATDENSVFFFVYFAHRLARRAAKWRQRSLNVLSCTQLVMVFGVVSLSVTVVRIVSGGAYSVFFCVPFAGVFRIRC